jgi:hypothetical protein
MAETEMIEDSFGVSVEFFWREITWINGVNLLKFLLKPRHISSSFWFPILVCEKVLDTGVDFSFLEGAIFVDVESFEFTISFVTSNTSTTLSHLCLRLLRGMAETEVLEDSIGVSIKFHGVELSWIYGINLEDFLLKPLLVTLFWSPIKHLGKFTKSLVDLIVLEETILAGIESFEFFISLSVSQTDLLLLMLCCLINSRRAADTETNEHSSEKCVEFIRVEMTWILGVNLNDSL